jgi:hypothetical protein
MNYVMIAFANAVLRTRAFSQEYYSTAAKGALVDHMLFSLENTKLRS